MKKFSQIRLVLITLAFFTSKVTAEDLELGGFLLSSKTSKLFGPTLIIFILLIIIIIILFGGLTRKLIASYRNEKDIDKIESGKQSTVYSPTVSSPIPTYSPTVSSPMATYNPTSSPMATYSSTASSSMSNNPTTNSPMGNIYHDKVQGGYDNYEIDLYREYRNYKGNHEGDREEYEEYEDNITAFQFPEPPNNSTTKRPSFAQFPLTRTASNKKKIYSFI